MNNEKSTANKAFALAAFDTLFNQRDYAAAEKFWAPDYVQHSAMVPPSREGLFELVRSLPPSAKYEVQLAVAEGDHVILHGRYSGLGSPANLIAADILRIENGKFVEHWDVLQDEATRAQSKGDHPMFGAHFPG